MINYSEFGFIFDMDGTLVDNMHFHADAWGKMLGENGVEVVTNDFLVKTAGKTNREIMPTVFPDISDAKIKELGDRKEEIYRELFLPERKPVDGAERFLNESKSLGIKMALATAAPIANMEFILDGLGLRKYFDAITTAADISNGKPDPEIFLTSAQKLSVKPVNCLVFEDALGGFEAADRAGMRSIGITTVNTAEQILALPRVVGAYEDFSVLDPRDLVSRHLEKSANAG